MSEFDITEEDMENAKKLAEYISTSKFDPTKYEVWELQHLQGYLCYKNKFNIDSDSDSVGC